MVIPRCDNHFNIIKNKTSDRNYLTDAVILTNQRQFVNASPKFLLNKLQFVENINLILTRK